MTWRCVIGWFHTARQWRHYPDMVCSNDMASTQVITFTEGLPMPNKLLAITKPLSGLHYRAIGSALTNCLSHGSILPSPKLGLIAPKRPELATLQGICCK